MIPGGWPVVAAVTANGGRSTGKWSAANIRSLGDGVDVVAGEVDLLVVNASFDVSGKGGEQLRTQEGYVTSL
jgi:hypothetical protein